MGLSAWAPPFNIFIIGTGNLKLSSADKYLYKLWLIDEAAALAVAMETAKIAFAPSAPLLSVPSSFIRAWSIFSWSTGSNPHRRSLIRVFILFTAFITPIPWYLSSQSRNSIASCIPVDAPEGTE